MVGCVERWRELYLFIYLFYTFLIIKKGISLSASHMRELWYLKMQTSELRGAFFQWELSAFISFDLDGRDTCLKSTKLIKRWRRVSVYTVSKVAYFYRPWSLSICCDHAMVTPVCHFRISLSGPQEWLLHAMSLLKSCPRRPLKYTNCLLGKKGPPLWSTPSKTASMVWARC